VRLWRRLDPLAPEQHPDGARCDGDVEPGELVLDAAVAQGGFSRAMRSASWRTSPVIGGQFAPAGRDSSFRL